MKTINNGRYTLYECTAMTIWGPEPQEALFCKDNENSDGDCVIFGCTISEIDYLDDTIDVIKFGWEGLESVKIK